MTEPTEAEIWQMWMPMVRRMGVADPVDFARAALAKWGTPQPTHAQAGAVPLTAKQMESGREAIFSTGNPYCPCDSKTFRKVAEWVERHHGIKQGGQHAD